MVVALPTSPVLPETIEVCAWIDSLVESCGFGPRSAYVEFCWLPVLGPSATWAYRRLGALVLAEAPARVQLADLAGSLGLGAGLGRGSKLAAALGRLAHFQVVRWQGQSLLVRRALAPLSLVQVGRISPSARAAHYRLTGPVPPAA
ncbi:MAG: hypothetical protein QOH36_1268 [Actinomycetota bacterium]|nr:hypothetical protein [Actinomycetota bacterium]